MASSKTGSATILVVDDDLVFTRLMVRVLEREGYHVLTAHNGDTAIALYTERPGEIAVVLLDLIIPPKGGLEVLEALLRLRPDLPLVLTSGDTPDEAVRKRLVECGGCFLGKPFHPRALLREIGRALDPAS